MITKDQAIKLANSKFWKQLSIGNIVRFQLFEDRLCMDWTDFHMAVESALNRPVFSHEFAWPDDLRQEFLMGKSAPTFEERLNLIPESIRKEMFNDS